MGLGPNSMRISLRISMIVLLESLELVQKFVRRERKVGPDGIKRAKGVGLL